MEKQLNWTIGWMGTQPPSWWGSPVWSPARWLIQKFCWSLWFLQELCDVSCLHRHEGRLWITGLTAKISGSTELQRGEGLVCLQAITIRFHFSPSILPVHWVLPTSTIWAYHCHIHTGQSTELALFSTYLPPIYWEVQFPSFELGQDFEYNWKMGDIKGLHRPELNHNLPFHDNKDLFTVI